MKCQNISGLCDTLDPELYYSCQISSFSAVRWDGGIALGLLHIYFLKIHSGPRTVVESIERTVFFDTRTRTVQFLHSLRV